MQTQHPDILCHEHLEQSMQPLTHDPFKQLQNWQLHTTSIPNLANQIKSITSQLLQYRNKTSDKYIQLKTVLKTEIKISYRNNRGICFNLCCIQALYLETSSSISLLSHRSFLKKILLALLKQWFNTPVTETSFVTILLQHQR